MSVVLLATGGAQALVAVIAVVAGLPGKLPLDLVFIGLRVVSGLLYRQASVPSALSTYSVHRQRRGRSISASGRTVFGWTCEKAGLARRPHASLG